jgi:hypothetical protein
MTDSPKNQGGRPTDFKDEYIHQAYVVCAEGGFTNPSLGKLFNVTARTISNWLRNIPEFKDAVQSGKDEFDSDRGERALIKRMLGFRYTETTKEAGEDGELKVTKKVSKYLPPDIRGLEMFLYNRRSMRWKRIKHVELTGADGGPIKTKEITSFPKEPETIKEWEEQVRDAEKHDKETKPDEETNTS